MESGEVTCRETRKPPSGRHRSSRAGTRHCRGLHTHVDHFRMDDHLLDGAGQFGGSFILKLTGFWLSSESCVILEQFGRGHFCGTARLRPVYCISTLPLVNVADNGWVP